MNSTAVQKKRHGKLSVLDRSGVVTYNQKGSVTPEILAALYEQASGG